SRLPSNTTPHHPTSPLSLHDALPIFAPELFHHTGDHRPSPDYRLVLTRQQQIDGHHFDSVGRFRRLDALVIHPCSSVKAVHPGNGGSGNIRVQDSHPVSHRCHGIGHRRCHK